MILTNWNNLIARSRTSTFLTSGLGLSQQASPACLKSLAYISRRDAYEYIDDRREDTWNGHALSRVPFYGN